MEDQESHRSLPRYPDDTLGTEAGRPDSSKAVSTRHLGLPQAHVEKVLGSVRKGHSDSGQCFQHILGARDMPVAFSVAHLCVRSAW